MKYKGMFLGKTIGTVFLISLVLCATDVGAIKAFASEKTQTNKIEEPADYDVYGGGYAITGQIEGVGYSTEIYDASNGLPTSDSMFLLGASDGHVWIGGYSGVVRYDGTVFERMTTEEGLTSARAFFEDSQGRIWVGTNDNGVVVIDGTERTHITYKEGLPSSSIRIFEEDKKGNIYIGTTGGTCYVDKKMVVHPLTNKKLGKDRVLMLDADSNGVIYGQDSQGYIFAVENKSITRVYSSDDLGIGHISTILADPNEPGNVYIGTSESIVYHGHFGETSDTMERIDVSPIEGIHWLNYDCGRVWVSSTSKMGYLDEDNHLTILDSSMDSGIEMMTSDYQGNMWVASSTQGVMKVVTNNYIDLNEKAKIPRSVANATCDLDGELYIGTDQGLVILNTEGPVTDDPLIEFMGDSRIRCIKSDSDDNLWLASYTEDIGLVCRRPDGTIVNYTTENGMPDNQVRCISFGKDGGTFAGTNGGLVEIKDGEIVRVVGSNAGIKNTVFLTVEEMGDGTILAGSDGDGIYVINGMNFTRIGRNQGLTSDVVMRIIPDRERGIYWLITSNSIQYLKDGTVTSIDSFPYNNNYDIYFDTNGTAWILSSYGVYSVNADEMYRNEIVDYRLDTVEGGLPFGITGNAYSCLGYDGNLYIPGREGVIKVNILNYHKEHVKVKMELNTIYCGNEKILPDENGEYTLPATKDRIQIIPSVFDYTMLNPTIRMYLEGGPDEGVIVPKNQLSALEYTDLACGKYTLHVQVLDTITADVLQNETFAINKKPRLTELLLIKLLLLLAIAVVTGIVVWRVMRSTVIRRQYEEIRLAKEEAERANTSKSRFLANMSHEIRTPINTIMGMNEMILREDPTGVPKEYFLAMMNYSLDIRNASESLLGLINDLLDMSKIESGKMHLVEQEYDVQDMLRSIVAMIRVRSIEKELTFDVVVDEILPKRMYGDMGKIKQIVLNLLTNAVKYTDRGGFILNVSMDEREDDVAHMRFSVKDTGIGVKEEDMEKLFSAYERLDEEKNSGIQGTGLGLDISRKFAELMGGNLWCESTYGQGSEFILTLNQKIVDATPIGLFVEHDEIKASGPYVPQFVAPDADILVVDDNPMNLSVIKGLLKATRVFVTTSASGEDALDKIRDNHFDVVLLDHMMPGMDGLETVAEIRKFAPDLPVYALTANATAGEEFYISKGFNGYLSKPVETEVLERTILKHLPESKVKKPDETAVFEELTEIPENMRWIYDEPSISVEDGIKNSGGIASYLYALELFLDTIDSNAKVISEAYENGNIRLYTIKVHALKSSARIIGAKDLSQLCLDLEDAGNRQDIAFIDANTEQLMEDYMAFKEKLRLLKESEDNSDDKPPISEEELQDAYSALKEVIPEMDYDSVEIILGQLSKFKLPEEDTKTMKELGAMLKGFDWDGMEELICK